ncbi:Hypothetical predicted protein [Marmota monax]|uniref:Uncharacterized protein n=1 Tax=Marmota monax TaxID=9995 RepID=A0A5E4C0E5_MARMO|nr:hypothetical protein GHT09_012101 [Marmota monax]VTJ74629.1 Hypothetical predicted protein [Marmota monax]
MVSSQCGTVHSCACPRATSPLSWTQHQRNITPSQPYAQPALLHLEEQRDERILKVASPRNVFSWWKEKQKPSAF